MPLPDGFLDELRSRLSIVQVVGRKVAWDNRKSTPARGDMWAPCPFHSEKTASFHVDDRKGFYYCFGCHAKGDAISFVRETENVGFMEAVEILAREAGMQMPAPDPKAAAKAEARKGLSEVMEAAIAWGRMQLSAAAAAGARAYLDQRGLTPETLKRFEIGFAPAARTAMTEALTAKGIPLDDLVAAGLTIRPDDGGRPYDRFRGRILFPIRDARGRAVAFGGRAMSAEARAKYLNSPETEIFDKGRTLYNLGPAREAAGKAGTLIVAEGYMDVIALAQAGLGHAVAPLGTAITETQLDLLWRATPEPVIALDGDQAGLRAARRLIDMALPLLAAGRALRFCLLPEGQDPDDLIRAGGAAAMRAAIDDAWPMVDLLWAREIEGRRFDSPERRAALDARLREVLGRITDPVLRQHYRDALREKRAALFGHGAGGAAPARGSWPRRGGRAPWGGGPPAGPMPATRASLLAGRGAGPDPAARVREGAILYACLCHPQVLSALEAELDDTAFQCPDLDALRRALLQAAAALLDQGAAEVAADALHRETARHLGQDPAARLEGIGQLRANPYFGPGAGSGAALLAAREELVRHRAVVGAEAELRDAEDDISGLADEGLTWRLAQAADAREAGQRSAMIGPAGAEEEDRAALSRRLQDMIDGQIWRKRRN